MIDVRRQNKNEDDTPTSSPPTSSPLVPTKSKEKTRKSTADCTESSDDDWDVGVGDDLCIGIDKTSKTSEKSLILDEEGEERLCTTTKRSSVIRFDEANNGNTEPTTISESTTSESNKKTIKSSTTSQVFFMIGCQRSGSNWLRTMLSEREDLIAPHPPHVMRDFMPKLGKYGDLTEQKNLKVSCIVIVVLALQEI